MNKWISIIRHHIRAKQEHRLLVQAMRNDPLPAPSGCLKQRLLADAAAASRLSHTQVTRPRLLWAVPAVVLAMALIGVVWGVNSHRNDSVNPARIAQQPASVRSDTHPVKPAGRHDIKVIAPVVRKAAMVSTTKGHPKTHRYPAVSPQQPQRVERVVALRRIASAPLYTPLPTQNDLIPDQYVVKQRLVKHNSIRLMDTVDESKFDALSSFDTTTETPSINVTVLRACKYDTGWYVYASAWNKDEEGRSVKTEWTITDDPHAQRTQELGLIPSRAADTANGPYAAIREPLLVIGNQIRLLSAQLKKLQSDLKFMTAQQNLSLKYRETAKRSESLSPKQQVLPQLKADMKQLREQITEHTVALAAAQRLVALAKPVDIVLKSARIRQAAEALSKVTSLKITVDAKVPNDISVKTEARGVPLGAVLEVIASAAHLSISPGKAGGLILMSTGKTSKQVNEINLGPNAPWSSEWPQQIDEAIYCPVGLRWLNLYGAVRDQTPMPTIVPTSDIPVADVKTD